MGGHRRDRTSGGNVQTAIRRPRRATMAAFVLALSASRETPRWRLDGSEGNMAHHHNRRHGGPEALGSQSTRRRPFWIQRVGASKGVKGEEEGRLLRFAGFGILETKQMATMAAVCSRKAVWHGCR